MERIHSTDTITNAMLATLPDPVQRYLIYTGVIGKPCIRTVHLIYTGHFRTAADKPWMPMRGEQFYSTQPPGFQWNACFRTFGLPLVSVCDTYTGDEGRMRGRLAGLVTLFDVSDEKLLQGTMLRYLQEMVWFPTAYLGNNITWQAVDDHAADVTFTHGGHSVTGRMYFDSHGRMLSFIAERYREHGGQYTLDTWSTPMTEYGTLEGLRVPVAGVGIWQLPEGDLAYINLRVKQLRYNLPVHVF